MNPSRVNSSASAAETLSLRHVQDLVEAVPFLLGFHPRRSVVLVGLTSAPAARGVGHVVVTIRLDTDDLADDGASSCASQLAASTVSSLIRAGARSVVGVVFVDHDDDPASCVRAMQVAGRACDNAGLRLLEFLVAPPSDGASASTGVSARSGIVAAQATYAGLVARPDRDSLVALLDPDPDEQRERHRDGVLQLIAARRQEFRAGREQRWRSSTTRALYAATSRSTPAGDERALRFGAALTDVQLRDDCWLAIEAGRVDGENLWRELAQRLPRPYDAAPLFLFGWIRWRAGDGALAGIAAQRALRSDPGYRAASMLAGALSVGLDPFTMPRMHKVA